MLAKSETKCRLRSSTEIASIEGNTFLQCSAMRYILCGYYVPAAKFYFISDVTVYTGNLYYYLTKLCMIDTYNFFPSNTTDLNFNYLFGLQ